MSRKRERAGIQTSDLHTVSLDSRPEPALDLIGGGSDGKTKLVNGLVNGLCSRGQMSANAGA